MIKLYKVLVVLVLIMVAAPNAVFAYSYGDPNEEDIAKTFKEIVVKVNASPPDWKAVSELYKVRRAEISAHFGDSAAETLDHNIADKNAGLVIKNYQYILVLNLERRFNYAQKDLQNYAENKLLLAKARGTFEVLGPYAETLKPGVEEQILTAFKAALDALGNPGLFGVGEEPVNREEFKKQTDFILKYIKPLFPYTPYNADAVQPTVAPTKKPASGQTSEEGDLAGHAPMARTDRTNPVISILIIGGVIVLIGGGIWYAKRKGLI